MGGGDLLPMVSTIPVNMLAVGIGVLGGLVGVGRWYLLGTEL